MSYTLQDFCADIHNILVTENNEAGREKVRQKLEKLLTNETFVEQFCGPDKPVGVQKLNEDPTTGAVVLSHVVGAGTISPPHDHGESWAIYGQAKEYTVMREWDCGDDSTSDGNITLKQTKEYRLDPGQVGVFNPGVIHSIEYPDAARFVRVTGVDLERIDRKAYNLKQRTVRTICAESADQA